MRSLLVIAAWTSVASVSFGQAQNGLPGGLRPIQKNGLPAGVGANAFNGGANNNGLNNNPFNNAFNNPYNRGFNPGANPFAGAYGQWNPYNTGYNPYVNPYNTGFGYPGWGYPQTPFTWSSYNPTPMMPGAYGFPYGSPYGAGYQLPPWYNGVSPAPIVGIGGPPFASFPGVQ